MRDLIRMVAAGAAGAAALLVLVGATAIRTDEDIVSSGNIWAFGKLITSSGVSSVGTVAGEMIESISGGFKFPDGTLQMTAAPRDPRRAFYVTASTHNGADADGSDGNGAGVCASGFHFASIYEILDVSNVRYATDTEGDGNVQRRPDSGQGPPSNVQGWVRTGFSSTASASDEGRANCYAWTSLTSGEYGTVVELEDSWDSATGTGDPTVLIAPWDSFTEECHHGIRVWCVEDYPGSGSV